MKDFIDILNKFDLTAPVSPHRIIDITDPGKDLDDEQKFVLSAGLQQAGFLTIAAVIACLEPPVTRARLAKGTFQSLGLPDIPVGVGSDCFTGGSNAKHETDVAYLATEHDIMKHGHELLVTTLKNSADHSVILTLNAGLTDAARLAREEPDLVTRKVGGITIMGGVKSASATAPLFVDGLLVPDDAANNAFDMSAAEYLYRSIQKLKIPMTIVMRSACYAAQFPIRLYDAFAVTNHPVGKSLKHRQKSSIQQLWQAALSPENSPVRGKLPLSRDRYWFVTVFCNGNDPGIGYHDDIWPFVNSYNQYDPMTIIAALPELRNRFFEPIEVVVDDILHRIIGLTPQTHGIKNKTDIITFMSEIEIAALDMN